MLQDHEIADQYTLKPIQDIAASLNIHPEYLLPYGHDKGKISLEIFNQPSSSKKRLVLVTAISPTPAGEGKTTTSIGLGQGLAKIGQSVCIALREPSLGPCMGVKGGATGGGHSQIGPAADINLHFTGDIHAISSAHNFLAATIDNHLHHGNELNINPKRILWPRVMDMNDRSLRQIMIGMGQRNGVVRESGFDISVASELMAILCLSKNIEDLRNRVNNILVAFTHRNQPVYAKSFNVTGAIIALLKDALMPNLVQTLEGVPVLVHGGPFANIAHGCNSIIATKMAMHLADWTITEAGFGCDLGAEKFLNIKCPIADIHPDVVVIVATIRALKMHGGQDKRDLNTPNLETLTNGLANLTKHIESIQAFNKPIVVAINHFHTDTDTELDLVTEHCATLGVTVSHATHFSHGGDGAKDLAEKVIQNAVQQVHQPLYDMNASILNKMEQIATTIYGADGVKLSNTATQQLKRIERLGYSNLPICMAKTQNSLSDDPTKLGRPTNFSIHVEELLINSGAGFIVAITGNMMRMPGLPKAPSAQSIDVINGKTIGIS